jgi:serine/threonine protein kinase
VVKQQIGQGAMGTVFLAEHEALDRTAAVKVMQALGDDAIAVGRFRREGRAIALLRHPNVVTVYDYGEFEGAPYMIEEYIAGGSLAARLQQPGLMDHPSAIALLRGMAAGLDYAHKRGIVHRDVKPANVLMGAEGIPVLADFGLARVEQQATMTASGVATGTPAYMAPEQISDEGPIGPPADIYALATVAYEMLTGRFPYESTSVMKMLMSKLKEEPAPPSARNPQLPGRVDSILLRGLARKPEARWKSCAMMVEALAAVLEPKLDLFASTQPIRRGGLRRTIRDWRRDWMSHAWVGLPIVALLSLVAVFVVAPRLGLLGGAPAALGAVPCPAVSPSPPQLAANPNPAAAGESVSFSGSGFSPGDPLFVVVDSAADCTNPTSGVKVFSTAGYTEPLLTAPSPLPDAITPGDYQVRACNHRTGEQPSNCVQVPFTVNPPPAPVVSSSRLASPSPT